MASGTKKNLLFQPRRVGAQQKENSDSPSTTNTLNATNPKPTQRPDHQDRSPDPAILHPVPSHTSRHSQSPSRLNCHPARSAQAFPSRTNGSMTAKRLGSGAPRLAFSPRDVSRRVKCHTKRAHQALPNLGLSSPAIPKGKMAVSPFRTVGFGVGTSPSPNINPPPP
ncbi:hypothetical protein VTK26DRAFT_3498 [Humicola hyalothermophila]